MKIIEAKLNGIRVEDTGKGANGDAKARIWKTGAKLHFIATIAEESSDDYDEQYKLYCVVKKDGQIARVPEDLEYSHGDSGCKNPCRKYIVKGNDVHVANFTAQIKTPGKYKVTIGNEIGKGLTTIFTIV